MGEEPGGDQAGGPVVKVTDAVWLVPWASTQPTVTESPGLWLRRAFERSWADPMVAPLTDTTVSPAPMPAVSAGLPDWTRWTYAPAVLEHGLAHRAAANAAYLPRSA